MKPAKYIGRVGGLAVALGAGAWLASVPWVASADTSDTAGLSSLDSLFSALPAADTDASGFDLSVSYNGVNLIQDGIGAQANTTVGSDGLAIAYGDGSTATAYGSGDTAIAENGGTAYSGQPLEALDGDSAGIGSDDYALADGTGSTATTGFSDDSIAEVFGTDSTATAGLGEATSNGGTLDNGDLAIVSGNDLSAVATGADNLYDIQPEGWTNVVADAAAAAPADDFGLSSLGADLTQGLDSLLALF